MSNDEGANEPSLLAFLHRDLVFRKMTLRYAHLAPSHLRAGIQALEERNPYLAEPALSTEMCVTPVSQEFGGSA